MALRLHEAGVPIVGVPKTIDNDLGGTDVTFGFQTAVQIVTDAIDRLHTTAESHNRVMVVEVMGRHAGWIATHAGIAGGADAILVPERPFDIEEVVRAPAPPPRARPQLLDRGRRRGRDAASRAPCRRVQGTATDAFGHVRLGGIGVTLEREIEQRTGFETRVTILGHVQRGGTPMAFDRVLATRFGVAAMYAAASGRFGTMVALRGTDDRRGPLAEALAGAQAARPRAVRDRGAVLRLMRTAEPMARPPQRAVGRAPPSTMRAMVFEEVGRPLRAVERPIPRPAPGQLLLKVRACGVCRTDLHLLDGEVEIASPPRILGHQIVGDRRVRRRERVGVPWLGWTCGECAYCLQRAREPLPARAVHRPRHRRRHGRVYGRRRALLLRDPATATPTCRRRRCCAPG